MARQTRRQRRLTQIEQLALAHARGHAQGRVMAVLNMVVEGHLLWKEPPTADEVWGVYWHGDRSRVPRRDAYVPRVREDRRGRVRNHMVPERADVLPTLNLLRLYGLRWEQGPDGPHTVHLIGPVYQLLLPDVRDRLAAEGRWPPRDPGGKVIHYRGPKRWTRQARGWRPA